MPSPAAHRIPPSISSHILKRTSSVVVVSPSSTLPTVSSLGDHRHHVHGCSSCEGLVDNWVHTHNQDHDWVIKIQREIDTKKKEDVFDCPTIFMAPKPLRLVNEEAFIPQVVAVGPYHSKRDVAEMERYKIMAARITAKSLRGEKFLCLVTEISEIIETFKAEYNGDFDPSLDETLSHILALDASFLIQLLRSCVASHENSYVPNGFGIIYCQIWPSPVRRLVLLDLLLLENQIPLSLLKLVMKHEGKEEAKIEHELRSFVLHIIRYVARLEVDRSKPINLSSGYKILDCKHLLDCVYSFLTEVQPQKEPSKPEELHVGWISLPTASKLQKSGVKLKASTENTFTNISFDGRGALSIPKISVTNDTEILYRNILAYECGLPNRADVLSYFRFMNALIDTPDDVAVLVESQVINKDGNVSCDEDIADLFNGLCLNTAEVLSSRCFVVAEELRSYYDKTMWKILAEFRTMYLSRPWLVAPIITGICFLAMTFITMYYTILLFQKD